jgi:hypothetical protein
MHGVLSALGINGALTEDFGAYERSKAEAVQYFDSGLLSDDDIRAVIEASPHLLGWDYALVDEGQDWPQDERDLLVRIFGPERIVVADGFDQLVRSARATNWKGTLDRDRVRFVELMRCLRMKSGLARFASTVVANLGLGYDSWEPHPDISGGRVVIVDGPFLADRALLDSLVASNAEAGNAPVDMLFCVPPAYVAQAASAGRRRSQAAAVFEAWGHEVWDGVDGAVRAEFATSNDQLRIVPYDSCRGLEGWTVVNLALDRFYEHKLALSASEDPMMDAARWLMIPLSRAIDTLVIQFDQPSSALRTAVERAANECADYVDILREEG